jgi:hypothetical protein
LFFEDPGGGNECVRVAPHVLERGRPHERGPGLLRDGHPELPGEPAHLAVQIGGQVVVVQPVAGVPCGLGDQGSGQALAGLEILLTSPTKVPSGVTAA